MTLECSHLQSLHWHKTREHETLPHAPHAHHRSLSGSLSGRYARGPLAKALVGMIMRG
jgi:hypothetical protein